MTVFTKRGVDIFAPTDAAGNLRKVINGEVQVWSAEVERAIYYAMVSGNLAYATKADLDADLAHDDGTVAWVVADTDELNGIYVKSGASGSGSWTKERNLPTGPQGDIGGVAYRFDAGTADADPGTGLIRANNADLSAATELYVSKSNRYGDDLSGFLATLAGSTSTHKGYLILTAPDSETQAAFNVTGVTDATGYVKLSVSGQGGATTFTDAERLIFLFSRTGNAGDLNGVNPGVTGLEVLEAETKSAARAALQLNSLSFSDRNLTNATAAAAQPNGTITYMAGQAYVADSTATGEDSLTYDLGVDGLVPLHSVTPRMCGAVGDAATDDLANLQRAWRISAAHKVPCFGEGLEYNCSEACYTASNLQWVAQGAVMYITAWPSVGAFVTNVVAGDPLARVQNNVGLYDAVFDGSKLPAPGAGENSNLQGFARGMYGAVVKGCTSRYIREGSGGGTGGGGFGCELGAHDVLIEDCTAHDCYRAFRANGEEGNWADAAAEPKSITNIKVRNLKVERCGTTMFIHNVGTGPVSADNLATFDVDIDGVYFHNCGHSAWKAFDFGAHPGISAQKSGVINIGRGYNTRIRNVRGYNDSTYPESFTDYWGRTGYPASGDYIGAGLSGPVGAIIWSSNAQNVLMENIDAYGNFDTDIMFHRCVAFGELATIPPNAVGNFEVFGLRRPFGNSDYFLDAMSGTVSGNIGARLLRINRDVSPYTALFAPSVAAFSHLTVEFVRGGGQLMRGTPQQYADNGWTAIASATETAQFASLEAGNIVAPMKVGGGYSASGAATGVTYDGSVLRMSRTGDGSVMGFYNGNGGGLAGQISMTGLTTSYATTSDELLKSNWRNFDSGAIIDALQVGEHDWIADGTSGYGVPARATYEVFPYAVMPGYGKPGEDGFIPWTVDYSRFVPPLLAEVKSLRSRMAALESK